jgi:DNA polymerase-1
MTKDGFKINIKKMKKLSEDFTKKSQEIEKEIFKIVGEEFNVKSTKQLSEILFEKMKIPTKGLKKTPKGVVSTKESELLKLKGEYEIIDLILEYRELTKMLTTYIDNLIPMVDKNDRLHPEFLQLGTATGRMSSKGPNIQNIPTGGDYGKKIRECFICEKDFSLVSFDYSQIELRVAAILSQDKKLIKAFQENKDIHSTVAEEIFGEENKETRRKAKIINFGILYGMGASSLRKNLNSGIIKDEISMQEARDYLDKYFEKFSGLAKYISKTKEEVKEKGYSTTLFGRKRFFPEINSKIPFIHAMAERMCVNAPIQGTATGDIVKIAMKKVEEFLEKNNYSSLRAERSNLEKNNMEVKILAQVHDELIFEISDNKLKKIIPEIEKIMEGILENSDLEKKYKTTPLKVSGVVGKN